MPRYKALKRPTDTWNDLLVYLLSSQLNPTTAREWQLSLSSYELPTLKQFHNFLSHRCQVLESTGKSSGAVSKNTRKCFANLCDYQTKTIL